MKKYVHNLRSLLFIIFTLLIIISLTKSFLYKTNEQKFEQANVSELSSNENALRFWIYIYGSEKVFEKFSEDTSLVNNLECHQLSHKIGRVAYDLEGKKVLNLGNNGCDFGILHGSVEAMVQKLGVGNLSLVSQECRSLKPSVRKVNCFHGAGHGFMAITHEDLIKSLELCRDLDDEGINNCSSGVFMESVMSLMESHNLHQASLSSNIDPSFPCNQVTHLDLATQKICFEYQASRVLNLENNNFDSVINYCQQSSYLVKANCFINVGQEAVYFFYPKFLEIVNICYKTSNPEDRSSCIDGVIFTIINMLNFKLKNEPHQICNILETEDKEKCYQTLGKDVKMIFEDDYSIIDKVCEQSEQDYIRTCKNYASLPIN